MHLKCLRGALLICSLCCPVWAVGGLVGLKIGMDTLLLDDILVITSRSGQLDQAHQYDSSISPVVSVALALPVPGVPNIALRYKSIGIDQDQYLAKLTTWDYLLFYEILDTSIVDFDLGVGISQVGGNIRSHSNRQHVLDEYAFFGYANVEAAIIGTPWYAFVDTELSLKPKAFSDTRLGLMYRFESPLLAVDLKCGLNVFYLASSKTFGQETLSFEEDRLFLGVDLRF